MASFAPTGRPVTAATSGTFETLVLFGANLLVGGSRSLLGAAERPVGVT